MKRRGHVFLSPFLFLVGAVLLGTTSPSNKEAFSRRGFVSAPISKHFLKSTAKALVDERTVLVNALGRMPLTFEANEGQADLRVDFLSRGPGYGLFLTTRGEAVLVLHKPAPKRDPLKLGAPASWPAAPAAESSSPSAIVTMKLAGGNAHPRVKELDKLPGKVNYFIGKEPQKWHTNVPLYGEVQYDDIYQGVDLIYYGNQGHLESDFVVAPGADPSRILLGFEGANKLEIDTHGDLLLRTKDGEIRQQKPLIYQEVNGVRREIAGEYALKKRHQVGFQVASYDASRPLIIDPALSFSTYLGGSGADQVSESGNVAVDSAGNVFVTGYTESPNFPTTSGALQPSFGAGSRHVFVTKIDPTGSGPVYSTFIGGSREDAGEALALDSTGDAYVAGYSGSSDFPTTLGAVQSTNHGADNAILLKLDPTGSALLYSTYLGGGDIDLGLGIAVDSAGNAYACGSTQSTNFPTTAASFQPAFGGGSTDAWAAKLNSTGTSLVYSTYLGGSDLDQAYGVAIDSVGSAYLTGTTQSSNFPVTTGTFQTVFTGSPDDGWVAKLNPAGSGLVYSTYLGGSGSGHGTGIAVDSAGFAYIVGSTTSTNFPTTTGTFQTSNGGGQDAFVAKLNQTGSALVYSTYIGGGGTEVGTGIAIDSSEDAFVTGATSSTNFPTVNPTQASNAGGFDAFVTMLNPLGSGLVFSTYLGGSVNDFGFGIAADSSPNPDIYATGNTASADFPTTSGAFQTTYGGGSNDVFVAKISSSIPPPCQQTATNSSNFDGTPVPAGDYVWFNANFKAHNVPSSGVTIDFTKGNISFKAGSTSYSLPVPNAKIIFSLSATCSSTTFDTITNTWMTTVPVSGDDEIFLTGLAWPVPSGGLPGGVNPVNFSGTYSSETKVPGLSIQMVWSAAAYSTFTTSYNALQVKPGHQTACGQSNGDHAGTPEGVDSTTNAPWKNYVVGGARGGGGSNFTGSWSGTSNITICPL